MNVLALYCTYIKMISIKNVKFWRTFCRCEDRVIASSLKSNSNKLNYYREFYTLESLDKLPSVNQWLYRGRIKFTTPSLLKLQLMYAPALRVLHLFYCGRYIDFPLCMCSNFNILRFPLIDRFNNDTILVTKNLLLIKNFVSESCRVTSAATKAE